MGIINSLYTAEVDIGEIGELKAMDIEVDTDAEYVHREDKVKIHVVNITVDQPGFQPKTYHIPMYHWLLGTNTDTVQIGAGLRNAENERIRERELHTRRQEYQFDVPEKPEDYGALPKAVADPAKLHYDQTWSGTKQKQFVGTAIKAAVAGVRSGLRHTIDGIERYREGQKLADKVTSEETLIETLDSVYGWRYREYAMNATIRNAELPLRWHLDETFGYQTVAGVNPLVLEALKPEHFTTDFQNQMRADCSKGYDIEAEITEINNAIASGRAFKLDLVDVYKSFAEHSQQMLNGRMGYIWTTFNRCVVAPFMILVVPERDEDFSVPMPKFVRLFPDSHVYGYKDEASWLIAKMLTGMAVAARHELHDHLGRTHLIVETAIVGALRNLPTAHPIFRLLHPHFYGTIEINADAKSPDGLVDVINAMFNLGLPLGVAYFQNWKLWDNHLEKDCKVRGVDQKPAYYPFRDHGRRVWKVLETFVGRIVDAFYTTDADVVNDIEFQNFIKDVQYGYEKKGDKYLAPGEVAERNPLDDVKTIQQMKETLTTWIWTASGMHNAINFAQFEFMGYPPNIPASVNPPRDLAPQAAIRPEGKQTWTYSDVVKFMPSADVVTQQSGFVELLSTYDRKATPPLHKMFEEEDWFDGDRYEWWPKAKAEFLEGLNQAYAENQTDNRQSRYEPYQYLTKPIIRSISL
eukprot:TRINITY_DN63726_c0_g1_i1.p1 TRINITY_DN63726_c0_g1~~TRINITY_DN63726_c0_g1_i1.p1  ORF type:complete len:782 (+),score=84.58 TRINITY_DN63726_c0_g1_i1:273-2348(+)